MSITERVAKGEELKVTLENDTQGIVFIDHDYCGEPHFMFQVTGGWAAGVTEAICETTCDYLETDFLKGATIHEAV